MRKWSNNEVTDATGVLLIGHGTRDAEGTAQFFQLADELRRRLGGQPVAPCLLEFQSPSIADAWKTLVDQGVDRVQVAPLLLFAAGHAKQDIPREIACCQAATSGVVTEQGGPISRHPAIVALLGRRLQDSLATSAAARQRTAVVMVGRGSHDPCAQADMRVLSEVVAHRVSVARVETAFYAMANPRLPEVIDRVVSTGHYDTVVVQPHLLFTGRLFNAIGRHCDEADRRHAGVRIICSDYLGPDPRVAEAIADRLNPLTHAQCR